MSNCIQIHQNTVRFEPYEFDLERFKEVLKEHEAHPRQPEVEDLFCWFLRENSSIEEDSLVIRFGQGESPHTWRDFKQTLYYLNTFITNRKEHTFLIADEYDGYDEVLAKRISWPFEY